MKNFVVGVVVFFSILLAIYMLLELSSILPIVFFMIQWVLIISAVLAAIYFFFKFLGMFTFFLGRKAKSKNTTMSISK
jgi:hypothetical protein